MDLSPRDTRSGSEPPGSGNNNHAATVGEYANKINLDYVEAYHDFVKSMCADLSVDPRTRCMF
jgi:hypothetical protein